MTRCFARRCTDTLHVRRDVGNRLEGSGAIVHRRILARVGRDDRGAMEV
jgi:hypothetical protein